MKRTTTQSETIEAILARRAANGDRNARVIVAAHAPAAIERRQRAFDVWLVANGVAAGSIKVSGSK